MEKAFKGKVYVYGESQTNPETHNLRGQLFQVKDGAGQVTFAEYDFKGNPLSKLQETLEDYETEVNWDNSQTFDTAAFTTTCWFSAAIWILWSEILNVTVIFIPQNVHYPIIRQIQKTRKNLGLGTGNREIRKISIVK